MRRKISRSRRRLPRPSDPATQETQYTRDLLGVNRDMVGVLVRSLGPVLDRAKRLERAAEAGAREDADADWFAGIDWDRLRVRLGAVVGKSLPLVDQQGRRMLDFTHRDMSRVLGIDLTKDTPEVRAILEQLRGENVDLIKSIADRLLDDVRDTIRTSTTKGTRVETLAKQIQERYQVSASRAELIARDQTLKANADLSRVRQQEAGVTSYVWSTSRDARVRDEHRALEGRTFAWNDPPRSGPNGEPGHPGQWFQCRCTAIPVLDDDEVETPKDIAKEALRENPSAPADAAVTKASRPVREFSEAFTKAWIASSRGVRREVGLLAGKGLPDSKLETLAKSIGAALTPAEVRLGFEGRRALTEALLRAKGQKRLKLYRGVGGEYADDLVRAREAGTGPVRVPLEPTSSWTTSPEAAAEFAGGGVVIEAEFGADQILLHHELDSAFGQGFAASEGEVVVLAPGGSISVPRKNISTLDDRNMRLLE